MDSPVEAELDPPFEVLEPAEYRGSVVFNSPHSGRVYPRAFLSSVLSHTGAPAEQTADLA